LRNKITSKVIDNSYSARSGSYAVADESIRMGLDEFGEYSYYKTKTFDYDKIYPVCSMSNSSQNEDTISDELFSSISNIKYNPVLGYFLDLYAGHVTEGKYRENASSGGLATWIFKELLEKKYIDGVIHVKKSTNKNMLFDYELSHTIQEICDGSKTKYYPVEFSRIIKTIKKKPGHYAIIGIPSLIMEIRLLSKNDSIINDRIKFALGLICGHQKSTKYAESMAWQFGIKPGSLKSIDFRKKIDGKSANMYSTEMVGTINGKETTVNVNQEEFFVTNWGHGFFKSKFSDFTDDAMNETADISLGDAWLPEYTKDGLGNNVLIVRNKIISDILKDGIRNGKIKLDKLTAKDIIRSQSGLIHHTKDELPYRLYKKDNQNIWRPKKRVSASNDLPYLRKKVQDLREKISAQSHINYKRAVELNDWNYFEKSMRGYVNRYNMLYKIIQLRTMGPALFAKKAIKKILK